MTTETSQLEACLNGRTCIVGLGNAGYGDDHIGVYLAEKLQARHAPNVIPAGATPERFLGRLRHGNFEHVIFVDAVEFGGEPGSVVFLSALEVDARFPQISTHKISIGTLARLIETGSTQVWLLGVQPGSLKPGSGLTPVLQRTADALLALLSSGKDKLPEGIADPTAELATC